LLKGLLKFTLKVTPVSFGVITNIRERTVWAFSRYNVKTT